MKQIYLLISVVFVIILMLTSVISAKEIHISEKIKERINKTMNPEPFDKIKTPLSSSAINILEHRKLFTDKVMGKKSKRNQIQQNNLTPAAITDIRFNQETGSLHQNEETIGVIPWLSGKMVVEGYNDYRGFYNVEGINGVSGYAVSTNDGVSILRDGSIPHLAGVESNTGESFIGYSGGDPVIDNHASDHIYYGSMFFNDTTNTWALGLARASPTDLADTTKTDDQIWDIVQVRADDAYKQANDKEWIAVDNSPTSWNGYVYMTWTAFNYSAETVKIWMARCSPTLSCTTLNGATNPISGSQINTQMSMVNVDDIGRVIVTWLEYIYTNPNPPYYKINMWYRVYAPGGETALTPPRLITTLNKPVSGYYAGLGNEFRIPPNIWSEIGKTNSGTPRLVLAYFSCAGKYDLDVPYLYDLLDDIVIRYADSCDNIDTYIKYVDNYQNPSVPPISPSIGIETLSSIHSFFPTMSINPSANRLDIAWYQSEPTWEHDLYIYGQQRDFSSLNTVTQDTYQINYAGDPDSETYFIPYGKFIGDYIQIVNREGNPNKKYLGYNANKRYSNPTPYTEYDYYSGPYTVKYGGYQQDNYLYTESYWTAAINILKNPGFEESDGIEPKYWDKYQTGIKATFTYPETGRIGGKSVAIKYPTKEIGKVALWWQPGLTVTPSTQYKLSGYMKLDSVTGGGTGRLNGADLRINWYKSDGGLIKVDLITKSGTSAWTKYENTFTSPSNAAKATIGGDLFNSSGKVWFDDMSFVKVS